VRFNDETSEKPVSSGKTSVAPSSRHFFYMWPVIVFPMHNRFVVARQTAPLGFLTTPTQRICGVWTHSAKLTEEMKKAE
jgi:hypothetical protein